jgi:hypothetical protein
VGKEGGEMSVATTFPHTVTVHPTSYEVYVEMKTWCYENTSEFWPGHLFGMFFREQDGQLRIPKNGHEADFCFSDDTDAMLFKLTWSQFL